MHVTRSTLNGNEAATWGGGIYNQWVVNISNSTVSDNLASEGGGLLSYCNGDVAVNNSTFTANRAKTSGGGGGIVSGGDGCSSNKSTISNTIVSGNVKNGTSTADDLALLFGTTNTFQSDGYNLIGTMGSGISFAGTGDQTNENDPKLESLANNGGDTKTHALMSDSLAIDNGECSSGPATDQRGEARPQDDTCDIGAYEKELPPAPTANFSGTPTSGTKPLEVDFSDASSGDITSYEWDFGDTESSTDPNPKHTYADAGTYTVSLTVTGPGGSDTETKTDYIEVTEPAQPPVAAFSGTPTSGTKPLEVDFSDASTGDISSYDWDFGDSNSSNQANPKHTYTTAGDYTVSLTVSGPGGNDTETKTNYISVADPGQPPVAAFSGTPTSGSKPLEVTFSDASTGDISSYDWDFGDSGSSSEANPKHIYMTAGEYTVSLTVTGPGGSNTETKANYISVGDAAPCEVVVTNTQSSGSGTYGTHWPRFVMGAGSPSISPAPTA